MLDDKNININSFPIDVIPAFFKGFIIESNKSLNFPIDYLATAMITAVSTMIGTSVRIKVKQHWSDYPSLYSCLIGNAGANKTHPINMAFRPLKIIDGVNHNTFIKQLKEFNDYEKLLGKKKENAKKVEKPILRKNITTNSTLEALNNILNDNPKGCAIVSDEMLTFFEGINNYSKGDQISNYLTIWNNQPITIDRVSQPVPLFIQTPFLSIIGGLQPRMLSSAFPPQKLNNGFYQRFLFAYPDNIHKQPINDNEMDENLINHYTQFVTEYINDTNVIRDNEFLNSREITWTSESKDFFFKWQKENTDKVNEYADTIKGEILNKFDNHFPRLALILQIMENPESCSIELKAVEGAEKLCSYYLHSSFKVLAILQNPTIYLKSLPENKINFYNALANEFKTEEAINICENYGIQKRRAKEFFKDEILFVHIKHGFYKKKLTQNN